MIRIGPARYGLMVGSTVMPSGTAGSRPPVTPTRPATVLVAFFPVFPLLLRGLGSVMGGDSGIAGSVTGVVAGGAAVLVFAGWVWARFPRAEAVTAITVLLLYPYSFFLCGAAYSDGLFLLTAVGAFVLLERRMYWLAGLVGAVAAAGRPVGVAVAVGLLVRMIEIRTERLPETAMGAVGPTGAAGGIRGCRRPSR